MCGAGRGACFGALPLLPSAGYGAARTVTGVGVGTAAVWLPAAGDIFAAGRLCLQH